MGGTVSVDNIAGVATAIAAGGPGALFWMLVSGLVGMATKFAEVVLGVHFRRREPGGPMTYILVTGCMVLTAYDTILAWCFYGETCCSFLFGHGRVVRTTYRVFWLPFILLGALGQLEAIWAVADTLNGLMAIPNLIALVLLSGVVVGLTKGFLAGRPYEPPAAPGRFTRPGL